MGSLTVQPRAPPASLATHIKHVAAGLSLRQHLAMPCGAMLQPAASRHALRAVAIRLHQNVQR